MVDEYDNWAKQRSRVLTGAFLYVNHIQPKYKPVGDMKILCLPGAKGHEITKIYDVLGIKRSNIFGVEHHQESFEALRKSNLGIELYHGSLLEVLENAKSQGRSWDIISMDLKSYFTRESRYMIQLIVSDHLLGRRGTLITNFLGKREQGVHKEMLEDIFHAIKHPLVPYGVNNKPLFEMTPQGMKIAAEEPFDLKHDRSETITRIIIEAAKRGRVELDLSILAPFYKQHDVEAWVAELKEDLITRGLDFKTMAWYQFPGRNDAEKLATSYYMGQQGSFAIVDYFRDRWFPREFLHLYTYLETQCYLPRAIESEKYTSPKGAPMLTDRFFLDQFEEELNPLANFFAWDDQFELCVLPNIEGASSFFKKAYRLRPNNAIGFDLEKNQKVKIMDRRLNAQIQPILRQATKTVNRLSHISKTSKDISLDRTFIGSAASEHAEQRYSPTDLDLTDYLQELKRTGTIKTKRRKRRR